MATRRQRSREDLLEEIDELRSENLELSARLDSVISVASGDDDETDDDDDDDEEEEEED